MAMQTRVHIYSTEKCPSCGHTFKYNNGFTCCHGAKPRKVLIQVTGIGDHPRHRIILYCDPSGLPLEPLRANHLKQSIEDEIALGHFNWRNYAGRTRKNLIWKNYAKRIYLHKLESRTKRLKNQEAWLAQSSYIEFEKYQRLYLIPHLGKYNLSQITYHLLQEIVDELLDTKGTYASYTIKRKFIDGARHMLNFAFRRGDIKSIPQFPLIKRLDPTITTLVEAQQKEIIGKIHECHHPIFTWLTLSGRRINEARAMKISDINFPKAEYRVLDSYDVETEKPFPKVRDRAGSILPLDDGIGNKLTFLKEIVDDRISGHVFINPNCLKPYTHNALRHIFDDARTAAGYDITLNEFGRHSWATQRLSEGWTYDQVAMFLLNTAAVVEERYANVNVAVRRAVVELHQTKKKKKKGKKSL